MNKCEICNCGILNDSQFINGKWFHNSCIENQQQEIERLNNKIDKAVEYIKTHTYDDSIDGDGTRLMFEKANGYDLLNILQGSDKE